jgi:hypothetical protein
MILRIVYMHVLHTFLYIHPMEPEENYAAMLFYQTDIQLCILRSPN